ncbi:MAG: 4Fe-4S dicluster domain-containing protein, partial [Pseudomonadota bacterium]
GTFLNRVHSFQVTPSCETGPEKLPQTVHFPKSCLHCDDAPCVTVCPTGASYKRAEDGIVLVNEDACMGCGLCAWACPYGAREVDEAAGIMKKCTLCVDRIYNEELPEIDREPACVRTCPAGARHFGDLADPDSDVSRLVAERGGVDLMPEQGTRPVNQYLPPRVKDALQTPEMNGEEDILAPFLTPVAEDPKGFLGWLDRTLEKL